MISDKLRARIRKSWSLFQIGTCLGVLFILTANLVGCITEMSMTIEEGSSYMSLTGTYEVGKITISGRAYPPHFELFFMILIMGNAVALVCTVNDYIEEGVEE